MAFNKDRGDAPMKRRGGMRRRKKVCVFCGDKNGVIDYKDTNKLKRYVSERGKILHAFSGFHKRAFSCPTRLLPLQYRQNG